jgi:RND family efflux transporter MFP subunit
MASSLREELASLKIDRRNSPVDPPRHRSARRKSSGGGGFGLRVLAFTIWLIPIALLSTGGIYAYKQYEEIRSKPVVTVGEVQSMTSGEAEKLLSAKGYLKSRSQSTLGAKVAGRVQDLFVEEGSKVTKGQVLAILEHNDLDAQLESRKATLLRGLADIEEAKADLDYKKSKADRARRLQNKNMSVSAEEMQQSTSSVDMGVAHLASLEATVKYQQAQVREVEESLANMKIVAPFDGTVVERPADLGEMISGGTVLTLADLARMDVETDLAENLLSRIALGQPAEVSVSAVPNKHYRGRLRQVIPISDRARGTVKVKVEILDPDENLFPELVATVHFLPDKTHQGVDVGKSHLFLPKSALVEEGGHSHVWLVDDKSAIHKTRVEVVVTNEDLVRVETGLKAGDRLVLKPSQNLQENEIVKIGD